MNMHDYEKRLQNALIEQHKKWFDYDHRTVKREFAQYIKCPVCDADHADLLFEKDWFTFVKCKDCSMVYLNPRLNEEATYAFYNSSWNTIYNEEKFDTVSASTAIDDRVNLANLRLIEQYQAGTRARTLLEIGIGKGFFLQKAQEAGYAVHGVELNEKNCSNARKLVGDTICNADLYQAQFAPEMFDAVYMKDVFEHVPDPRKMLSEIHRIGKKDAVVFIEVPNVEGLIYHLVKKRHVCVFGFEHLNYWSTRSLGEVLKRTGFEVVDIRHESLDFTISRIASHFFGRPQNCVHETGSGPILALLAKAVCFAFALQPLRFLDEAITPKVADIAKRGSVIKVVARKVAS